MLITGQALVDLANQVLTPSPHWSVNDNQTGVDFTPSYPTGKIQVSRHTFHLLYTPFTLVMPSDVYALIGTRSWAAQQGLDVCGSSAMVEPGFEGGLVLEVASRRPTINLLNLNLGTPHIATLRFFATEARILNTQATAQHTPQQAKATPKVQTPPSNSKAPSNAS
jgi:deoxycytidine triphosphate deaminase